MIIELHVILLSLFVVVLAFVFKVVRLGERIVYKLEDRYIMKRHPFLCGYCSEKGIETYLTRGLMCPVCELDNIL